ncbi:MULTISPECIES: YibE/F family protein [unclassified Nocardioides]|uniref:YibE/F family protein n=1 Tax=unclassified Nocardioides TaxID=2615069 RepID=UPI000A492D28|nr:MULTISPECIES: YibE/F family protein [unclassified Nocardioides]
MGAGHSHRATSDTDADHVSVGTTARTLLLAGLGIALLATLVALVVWWPPSDVADRAAESGGAAGQFAAPGVTFPSGEIVSISARCPGRGLPDGSGCSELRVEVDGEGEVAVQVPPEVLDSGIAKGDHVELLRTPTPEAEDGQEASYSYFATERNGTLVWLTLFFVVVVISIARWRGVFALVGLAFGGLVVWWWMLPALLDGSPGVGVALTSAAAIMFVVLYTTHGFSLRTSTALAGTLVGIVLAAGIGVIAIGDAHLTGISDESGAILATFGTLDFQALLGCALVIAGLGVLNDVTITQASAVWELRAVSPEASRAEVFASAMRIGRDHIASTIYTIVFAYVGTALILLMLLRVYDRPLIDLLSTEQLAEEVIRTLVTSVGLVLAVPITTALATLVASPARPD